MQQLLQSGCDYQMVSQSNWEGSKSNRFHLKQRQHFLARNHFPLAGMVPRLSDSFAHKEKRHLSPQKSPQKELKFSSYTDLYKSKDLPRVDSIVTRRTSVIVNNRGGLRSLSQKDGRSQSLKPILIDSLQATKNATTARFHNGTLSNAYNSASLSKTNRLPINYDIVNYHDLYLHNKRSLQRDDKQSLAELLTFAAQR